MEKIQGVFSRYSRAEQISTIIAAIFIGILGAAGAIGFRYVIEDRPGAFPSGDYVISPGDKLLVLGALEDIRRLQAGDSKTKIN